MAHEKLCQRDDANAHPQLVPSVAVTFPAEQREELLVVPQDGGEEIQILCSWSPVNVWLNLPESSPASNDSIILNNYGDEDMPWVVDMIDNNASFETDPFYTAHVFEADQFPTENNSEMKDIAVFNTSVQPSALSALWNNWGHVGSW